MASPFRRTPGRILARGLVRKHPAAIARHPGAVDRGCYPGGAMAVCLSGVRTAQTSSVPRIGGSLAMPA
jgi:hypothetical protein